MTGVLDPALIARAADAIRGATALVVTAGAGMGVDSGLPDFRGPEGFWRAYPPYQKLGLAFEDLANPRWFVDDPHLAWGFYGHRLNLYRQTRPHEGFAVLKRLSSTMRDGSFVFTSNVDGQFAVAGFDEERIAEVHGAIRTFQCVDESCSRKNGLWPAPPAHIDVDETTFRARDPLPGCPHCGRIARPNILMFGDWGWDDSRSAQQEQRLTAWLERACTGRVVVIESGAGGAILTVRRFGESLARQHGATLIRLNVREPQVPPGQIGISAGAKAALLAIDAALHA